jgi:hypothetical protein
MILVASSLGVSSGSQGDANALSDAQRWLAGIELDDAL